MLVDVSAVVHAGRFEAADPGKLAAVARKVSDFRQVFRGRLVPKLLHASLYRGVGLEIVEPDPARLVDWSLPARILPVAEKAVRSSSAGRS